MTTNFTLMQTKYICFKTNLNSAVEYANREIVY